jgi:hypothetical protein
MGLFHAVDVTRDPVSVNNNYIRIFSCELLVARNMKIAVVWDVTPCSVVEGYQRFRETSATIFRREEKSS